jgi:predicted NBD/HSP70 family sugar kinase
VYASNWAALRYYQESGGADCPTFKGLLSLAKGGDALALAALDRMTKAIGRGLRMIVAGLSPEEIVFVGDFTRLWDRVGPGIEADLAAATLVGKPPRVRPAEAEPSIARLRGTVALVLQKHFGPTVETQEADGVPHLEANRQGLARVAR